MSVIKSSFLNNFFGFYDGMTSEYAPGLLKYDVCMTEQVSGPQRTKIAGRHMVMIPMDGVMGWGGVGGLWDYSVSPRSKYFFFPFWGELLYDLWVSWDRGLDLDQGLALNLPQDQAQITFQSETSSNGFYNYSGR